ncbi:MAG: hypothetical protein FWF66_01990 [Candidatus Bathyarchaeota archaeon]|nr:hypothetical protein [Candidatus Termiticorpusculum sp.]
MFKAFLTDKFAEQIERLTKKDAALKKRLYDQITEMEKEQQYSQVSLKGVLRGKWKMRVGDYRILYAYCQDCKLHKNQSFNGCSGCGTKGDNALRVFTYR